MILNYNNTELFYTDTGSGNAVVLLHGFLENHTIWDSFINTLSAKHRIICIDLLGHGKSGGLGNVHTMENMAHAVYAVLNHIEVHNCKVIGHSMGGYVALALAELYPNLVNGFCLANSTPLADDEEKKLNRDRAIEAVKQNHRTFIQLAISNLFYLKTRDLFKQDIANLKREAFKMDPEYIIAALKGMKVRKDRSCVFKLEPCKKMIIIGKNDSLLNALDIRNAVEGTNTKIVEFPDGHMSFIENKMDFLNEIMHFIE